MITSSIADILVHACNLTLKCDRSKLTGDYLVIHSPIAFSFLIMLQPYLSFTFLTIPSVFHVL